jgi:transposase-like protein
MSKFARRYDREFKENAVALFQGGRSVTQVARDLSVSHGSLSRWVKKAQARQAGICGSIFTASCRIRPHRHRAGK